MASGGSFSADPNLLGYGLLLGAGGFFAGGIYGLKRAAEHNTELNKAIEKKRAEGKILAVSGKVAHTETRLNDKGNREHVVSIIEYRDNKGERHTIRSSKQRFLAEQVDVCYEPSNPNMGWPCEDGVSDSTAVGLTAASVLSLVAGGTCVYVWAANK